MESKTIQKIIITGPESTGKTTLANQLAEYFDTVWVPEYARIYLSDLERDYTEKDLFEIAKGQVELEEKLIKKANQFLICDSSMLVMKVWSKYKYGRCHPFILEQLTLRKNAFFILCGIDIPWEYDEWRENPHNRKELYEIYKSALKKLNSKFFEITGNQEDRLKKSIEQIKKYSS